MKTVSSKILKGILLVLSLCVVTGLSAQSPEEEAVREFTVQPRVAGLETNQQYMLLLEKESELIRTQDSLNLTIAQLREEFRNDSGNRRQNSDIIRKLENNVFEIRSNIGAISVEINAIEQDYILNNLDSFSAGSDEAGVTARSAEKKPERTPNLVNNPFFEENLSADDYRVLLKSQEMEKPISDRVGIYRTNYNTLKSLASQYEQAAKEAADSIRIEWERVAEMNSMLASSIDSAWAIVYDNKVYSYNYLFDRNNERELLREFDSKISRMREKRSVSRENFMSDALLGYMLQKELLLDYELTLAEMLRYNASRDSLKKALAAFEKSGPDFPLIAIKERFFIDYEPVETHNPPKYNTRTPIPAVTVYPRGVIYRVLVGSYTRQQAVSVFKGLYPLGFVREGSRYLYYAGGYETLSQAAEGLDKVRKLGFKEAKLAVWDFGEYSILNDPAVSPPSGGSVYRVDISGTAELSDVLKSTITRTAPGKDIMRTSGGFSVGPFTKETEAKALADSIKSADGDVAVSISSPQLQ